VENAGLISRVYVFGAFQEALKIRNIPKYQKYKNVNSLE